MHRHERAQAVEEVRQVVEVALERDGDRQHRVAPDRRVRLRRDRVEADARVARELAQLEEEVGHVRPVRHGLREPVDVGDLDLRRCARSSDLLVVGVDLRLNLGGLGLQVLDLRALRAHEQEPAGEADDEDRADHDSDQRSGLECLEALHDRVHVDLHEPGAPETLMSAAIENSTTSCPPTFDSVELISCTFVRSGTTCRRESSRATPSCE